MHWHEPKAARAGAPFSGLIPGVYSRGQIFWLLQIYNERCCTSQAELLPNVPLCAGIWSAASQGCDRGSAPDPGLLQKSLLKMLRAVVLRSICCIALQACGRIRQREYKNQPSPETATARSIVVI